MTGPCPDEEDFAELLRAGADPKGLEALLEHLDSCGPCRELAVALSRQWTSENPRLRGAHE
jgi:hypothetical protein